MSKAAAIGVEIRRLVDAPAAEIAPVAPALLPRTAVTFAISGKLSGFTQAAVLAWCGREGAAA